jgi:hypothetical protein
MRLVNGGRHELSPAGLIEIPYRIPAAVKRPLTLLNSVPAVQFSDGTLRRLGSKRAADMFA